MKGVKSSQKEKGFFTSQRGKGLYIEASTEARRKEKTS